MKSWCFFGTVETEVFIKGGKNDRFCRWSLAALARAIAAEDLVPRQKYRSLHCSLKDDFTFKKPVNHLPQLNQLHELKLFNNLK